MTNSSAPRPKETLTQYDSAMIDLKLNFESRGRKSTCDNHGNLKLALGAN